MAAPFVCARCKTFFPNARCTGESGIYGAHHLLCEPCFLDEDEEITEKGTNNLPERLEHYGPPNRS